MLILEKISKFASRTRYRDFAIRSRTFGEKNLSQISARFNQQCTSNLTPPQCLRDELLCKVKNPVKDGSNKVTIVGAGMVGVACANAILFQRISSHIAFVDSFAEKLKGEALDYYHGSVFLDDPRVEYSTDFCVSGNSKIVIIAAGARQKKDETRLDLVQRNADVIKKMVPQLVRYSPKAVFLIVSNPVDILTWVTWKVSGLPMHQVIGSGTHLDSARFRYLIADRIGISPSSVQAYIIGEHGDSQVPLWSGVSVAGVQFRDISPKVGLEADQERWSVVAEDVRRAGACVRSLKGYSNTAIGLSVADIARDVLRNAQTVKTVSTMIKGHYGVNHEMYLSLPCAIGENGVTQIARVRMTDCERKLLQASANTVHDVQKGVRV